MSHAVAARVVNEHMNHAIWPYLPQRLAQSARSNRDIALVAAYPAFRGFMAGRTPCSRSVTAVGDTFVSSVDIRRLSYRRR